MERRGADKPAAEQRLYFAESDDRGANERTIEQVRSLANGTFYRKTGQWVDASVADETKVDETVVRWSSRFFDILKTTNGEENARLAQAGPLVLKVQGRVLRVVD
jgi:hypothetical protein